jgi:hypothetical protein
MRLKIACRAADVSMDSPLVAGRFYPGKESHAELRA